MSELQGLPQLSANMRSTQYLRARTCLYVSANQRLPFRSRFRAPGIAVIRWTCMNTRECACPFLARRITVNKPVANLAGPLTASQNLVRVVLASHEVLMPMGQMSGLGENPGFGAVLDGKQNLPVVR
jgi:hypothetical protein